MTPPAHWLQAACYCKVPPHAQWNKFDGVCCNNKSGSENRNAQWSFFPPQFKSYTLSHELVKHPKIKAVGFTGSFSGGSALNESVLKRRDPIPFFAEMGSINPIAITAGALEKGTQQVAQKIASSIVLGAGQFCTQPGLLLTVDGEDTDAFINELNMVLKKTDHQCMIHPDLKKNYVKQSDKINSLKGTIKIQVNKINWTIILFIQNCL